MATNTYVALDKVTLTNAAASATFSSISSAYTDLIIVANLLSTTSARVKVRVGNANIDTSNNYAYTVLFGNGTSAGSGGETSVSEINYYWNAIPSGWSNYVFNFQNYSNTTTNKTVIGRGNSTAVETFANVGIWRATNAINIIEIRSGTGTFDAGSTFSLYGIRSEGVSPTVKATGGAVYSDDVYYYHVFGSTGTFTPTQSITADILVVAGGGGGGQARGAGGGAGGLLGFASQSLTATGYTCTVGSGGANKTTGSDSQFGALTLVKGGGFGGSESGYGTLTGGNGGSGGGGSFGQAGGSPTSGQGFAGGGNTGGADYQASGGGGAGAVGFNGDSGDTIKGGGGIGSSAYSSWCKATGLGQNVNETYYLAGGGGSSSNRTSDAGALGGSGGGGRGANTSGATGSNGTANTGGGAGGGHGDPRGNGGIGGSGLIIVRYAK
jgi:hypothetical protein